MSSKTYAFIIAANVPAGAEVGTGYSSQYLRNLLDVPADLVQIARGNEHVRFEWRRHVPAEVVQVPSGTFAICDEGVWIKAGIQTEQEAKEFLAQWRERK